MSAKAAFSSLSGSQRIDGQLTRASGAASIDVIDPATEERIGQVAEATAEDVTQAVAAANMAQRAWRKVNHHRRAELLHEVARRVIADRALVAEMLTREMGKPYKESVGRGGVVRERDRLLRGDRPARERQSAGTRGRRPISLHDQGSARCRGHHSAVQLSALPSVLAGRRSDRQRQRRHHQALGSDHAHDAPVRRRVRRPAERPCAGDYRGRRCRQAAGRAPGYPHGRLHRRHRDRTAHRGDLRTTLQAHLDRDIRQRSVHRDALRAARYRRARRGVRRVPELRASLRGGRALLRARAGVRGIHRSGSRITARASASATGSIGSTWGRSPRNASSRGICASSTARIRGTKLLDRRRAPGAFEKGLVRGADGARRGAGGCTHHER